MEFLLIALCIFILGGGVGWLLAFSEIKSLRQRVAVEKEIEEKFKGLSIDALKENHALFMQLATNTMEKFHEKSQNELEKKHQGVSELLKPVKESLEKFDGKIHELEKARIGAYTSIKEQVTTLIEAQKALRQETYNLVTALRAPHVRGRWGEIQLRRVVELAGMLNHCDFFEQQSVTTEGERLRPDLLVKLPGNRNIIVDAKAPLTSYLEGIETNDLDLRKAKMQDHARVIRNHTMMLGRKAYWDQFKPTPEFVVLFLPAETFFSAALEYDPQLIEAGVEERVILATPTTLIALLKSIAYGWRQESIAQNAEQISLLGKELYKRISDMGSHFGKLGKNLEHAVDSYNKAMGSLETRVMVGARRFKDLEVNGTEKEIDLLEPIEKTIRQLQVPELQTEDPILPNIAS